MNETYPTWAEAQRAGAVARGWIPDFVPSSAREIRDTHDLDTNRQTLQFTAPPSDVPAMTMGLRSVSIESKGGAADLLKKFGFPPASRIYVTCSKPPNGALVVDHESGRAVYTTAVEWADDQCSQRQ